MMYTAIVTAQLSICFLSVTQKRVGVLVCSTRRRKFRFLQICLYHFHTISRSVLLPKSWVYTQKFKISGESCSTYHSTQKTQDFSDTYPLVKMCQI